MDVGEGEEEKGWLNWSTSLLRSGSEVAKGDDTVAYKTKGWLGWLPWIWERQRTLFSRYVQVLPLSRGQFSSSWQLSLVTYLLPLFKLKDIVIVIHCQTRRHLPLPRPRPRLREIPFADWGEPAGRITRECQCSM